MCLIAIGIIARGKIIMDICVTNGNFWYQILAAYFNIQNDIEVAQLLLAFAGRTRAWLKSPELNTAIANYDLLYTQPY